MKKDAIYQIILIFVLILGWYIGKSQIQEVHFDIQITTQHNGDPIIGIFQ